MIDTLSMSPCFLATTLAFPLHPGSCKILNCLRTWRP